MRRRLGLVGAAAVAALLATGTAGAASATAGGHGGPARHVLLVSVDGMHESDLAQYVATHRHSALAALVRSGRSYTGARTTFPSDSFPGMVAQLTGADPGTAGVYYDDTFNRTLLPAGTTSCPAPAVRGAEVSFTEAADRSQNPIALDAGQGIGGALAALPTNSLAQTLADRPALTSAILRMTATPATLLDPAALPVDPATCAPVYPHSYLRVNTVFEVARKAGLRTAWSDKHPAYEVLNGPSGTGVQDLFTPEINSVADAAGDDWTTDNALTREYDSFKVAAVLNEIDGFDHSRSTRVGTPAVFGMNFQSVSTAQKLPTSDGLAGGYLASGRPGPLLSGALDFVDAQVGRMLQQIRARHLTSSTTVILSAKHGQSPIQRSALRRVDDGAIVDAVNAAWKAAHPTAAVPLVSFAVDDDVMLLWLSDRSAAARSFVASYLMSHSAPANRDGDPKGTFSTTVASSGLVRAFTVGAADRFLGAPAGDPHAPDLVGLVRPGVVYTGKVSKIAEHGGDTIADRNVPLVARGAGVHGHRTVTTPVATTRIAPTILALLGLDPKALAGVRIDHTAVLPGIKIG